MIWNPFRKLQKVEEKRSMPTVKFAPDRVTPDVQRVIARTIDGLPDVTAEQRPALVAAAIEACRRGRDLHHFASAAISVGIEKKRAGSIALYVTNVAWSRIDVAKQLSLGFTTAKWSWSHTGCGSRDPGSKMIAEDHRKADGKKYRLDTGLKIKGEYVFPGEQEGCKCTSQVIVPGFDD